MTDKEKEILNALWLKYLKLADVNSGKKTEKGNE
jgi:hypothetical protein